MQISRRNFLARAALGGAALLLPVPACARPGASALAAFDGPGDADRERLASWLRTLRSEGLAVAGVPLGRAVARVGELALGAPYAANTLEAYLAAGGSPAAEPLTLHLLKFDCVSLVEACLAVARTVAAGPNAGWDRFAAETERMRYRGGVRRDYASRLHYFSEWMADGARRGLVRDLGPALGARPDARPLRFMSEHRASYAALADDASFRAVMAHERRLDASPRNLVAKARIPEIQDQLQTGDVLAFATPIVGLDVTHTGLAYRSADGVMRVLHAPLSGGVVQVSPGTVADYVNGLRNA
ncbi:MAG TPA: N-acetylmuramoyl-L-alanine amidase-like domain-containing protein, partial [Longimicrobium sp.]|nr:N-acetylmuramoyl-L-alanine amidase-like domain-containing protein [Longimicrobium sp.]